jgi:hypothetical protein
LEAASRCREAFRAIGPFGSMTSIDSTSLGS